MRLVNLTGNGFLLTSAHLWNVAWIRLLFRQRTVTAKALGMLCECCAMPFQSCRLSPAMLRARRVWSTLPIVAQRLLKLARGRVRYARRGLLPELVFLN